MSSRPESAAADHRPPVLGVHGHDRRGDAALDVGAAEGAVAVRKSGRARPRWRDCDCTLDYCRGRVPDRTYYNHMAAMEEKRASEAAGRDLDYVIPMADGDGDPAMLDRFADLFADVGLSDVDVASIASDHGSGTEAPDDDHGQEGAADQAIKPRDRSRELVIFPGSPATRERCAAAYQALASRWNPPRDFMQDIVSMNRELFFPRDNVAPATWLVAQSMQDPGARRYSVLHLCPGPHRRSGDVACGFVYLPDADLQSCPECGQYRLVRAGIHEGQPRLFGIVFDLHMILRDKFATPGYSSQLNPTHGRQSPSSRPLDAVAECIWDSEIWREKMEQCPVMRSDRRHIALSLAQDSVSLTVDKKGGSSMHLYVLRDESLPPDVARKHENLELLAIVPNTYLTVDGERRRSKSEYIPFTKHIIGVISEAWTKGCDVLDADSQPPLMAFCVRPKLIFDVADYPGGCEIHGQLGSGATYGCIKCLIAGLYLGPGHMAYLDFIRFLPDDHPFRWDLRFGGEEMKAAPSARTHTDMTEQGQTAAEMQARWRRGLRGAPTALGKHGAATGIKNLSATASLPGRDDVQDQALDGMHTLAVVIGRIRDAVVGVRPVGKVAIAVKGMAESAPVDAPPQAPPAKRPSAAASSDASGQRRWEYLAVVAHKNASDGARSEYEVLWADQSKTWEAAEQVLRDVQIAESVACNAVTVYETDLIAKQHGDAAGVSFVHDRLRWGRQLEAIALEKQLCRTLDDGLNRVPYNPKLLPLSARRPLTRPQALKMRDTIRWGEGYAAYQLRGQWRGSVEERETGRIVRQFLALMPRLLTRSVSERDIQALEVDIPAAMAELVSVCMCMFSSFAEFDHTAFNRRWCCRQLNSPS